MVKSKQSILHRWCTSYYFSLMVKHGKKHHGKKTMLFCNTCKTPTELDTVNTMYTTHVSSHVSLCVPKKWRIQVTLRGAGVHRWDWLADLGLRQWLGSPMFGWRETMGNQPWRGSNHGEVSRDFGDIFLGGKFLEKKNRGFFTLKSPHFPWIFPETILGNVFVKPPVLAGSAHSGLTRQSNNFCNLFVLLKVVVFHCHVTRGSFHYQIGGVGDPQAVGCRHFDDFDAFLWRNLALQWSLQA